MLCLQETELKFPFPAGPAHKAKLEADDLLPKRLKWNWSFRDDIPRMLTAKSFYFYLQPIF